MASNLPLFFLEEIIKKYIKNSIQSLQFKCRPIKIMTQINVTNKFVLYDVPIIICQCEKKGRA